MHDFERHVQYTLLLVLELFTSALSAYYLKGVDFNDFNDLF